MSVEPKKILLLCNYYPGAAGTIIDHIEAFKLYSKHEYFILSNMGDLAVWLDLSRFDALVFHYTLVACYDNYISPAGRKQIREFRGFKAAFIQDDYRWINDTVNAFAYMGIHALFPLTGPDIIDLVYDPKRLPNVRKETVLAGYVPQNLVALEVKSFCDRPLDVGYRARKLPAWMGSHTLQKWQIAEQFCADAKGSDLSIDISFREEDRIYGSHWVEFVSNCRATLGTESGASLCDFTGDIQRNVEAHLLKYPETDFDTLRNLYFRDGDCQIMMNVISPRCFESAALRTLMILYEGDYSGVLVPWRHYVPLKRDHSNMDEVVRILRSPNEAQKIIDQAYVEVAKNDKYSYAAMVDLVDRVMDEEWRPSMLPSMKGFLHPEFDWYVKYSPKIPDNAELQQVEMSLYFSLERHQENSGAKLSSTDEVALQEKDAQDLNLRTSMVIKYLAVRLEVSGVSSDPQPLVLKGLRSGKTQFVHTIANVDHVAFMSIDMPFQSSIVDAIQICGGSKSNLGHVQVLSVSVVATAPATRMWVLKLRQVAEVVVVHCWLALPERARYLMQPMARRIKITASDIFTRLIG
jgi:hypothetical protein